MESKRQVRVDGRRAEADEQRHVVHLAGVAGLDDEPDLGPGLLVGRGGGARPRSAAATGSGAQSAVALRSDSTMTLAPSAMASETRRRTSSMARRSASPRSVGAPPGRLAHVEEPVDGEGLEARRLAVLVDVHELGQLVVGR